jgi:hypothetical protein
MKRWNGKLIDWLLAIAVSDLIAMNIIVFTMLFYMIIKRKTVDNNFKDLFDGMVRAERKYKKRISELEKKIEELEELFVVADDKILKLMAMNEKSEENFCLLGKFSEKNKKSSESLRKEITREINEQLKNFKLDVMNKLKNSNHQDSYLPIDKEPYTEVYTDNNETEIGHSIFTNYVPPTAILPTDYGEYSKSIYKKIRELAESGLDENEISRITQTELNTVRLVLGVNKKKNKR